METLTSYLTATWAWVQGGLPSVSPWITTHLSTICTVITTTLLVIFGDEINGFVKEQVQGRSFVLRMGAFVALCAFGYGILSVVGAAAVRAVLLYAGPEHLTWSVVAAFVVMGLLAERRKYM